MSELPSILKIERESFGADAWPPDLFREYARYNPRLFLVARAGPGIAGYSITCVTPGKAEIVSIAVSPKYRGRGIASRLLSASIRGAWRAGASTVMLMVRRDNTAAIQLYRRFGFVRTATVKGYYEDGGTGWRMRLLQSG